MYKEEEDKMGSLGDNKVTMPTAPKGFWGTLGDILKERNNAPRRTAGRRPGGVSKPQPKKPCGGCK